MRGVGFAGLPGEIGGILLPGEIGGILLPGEIGGILASSAVNWTRIGLRVVVASNLRRRSLRLVYFLQALDDREPRSATQRRTEWPRHTLLPHTTLISNTRLSSEHGLHRSRQSLLLNRRWRRVIAVRHYQHHSVPTDLPGKVPLLCQVGCSHCCVIDFVDRLDTVRKQDLHFGNQELTVL